MDDPSLMHEAPSLGHVTRGGQYFATLMTSSSCGVERSRRRLGQDPNHDRTSSITRAKLSIAQTSRTTSRTGMLTTNPTPRILSHYGHSSAFRGLLCVPELGVRHRRGSLPCFFFCAII